MSHVLRVSRMRHVLMYSIFACVASPLASLLVAISIVYNICCGCMPIQLNEMHTTISVGARQTMILFAIASLLPHLIASLFLVECSNPGLCRLQSQPLTCRRVSAACYAWNRSLTAPSALVVLRLSSLGPGSFKYLFRTGTICYLP